MQALLQLAALDYSYKRYPAALEKYALLHAWYAEQGLKELQALCLQGTGDVLRAVGKLEQAKERYQQGLATLLEVSQSRLELLQARTNLAQAVSDFLIADAGVLRSLGGTTAIDGLAAEPVSAGGARPLDTTPSIPNPAVPTPAAPNPTLPAPTPVPNTTTTP
jgi:tetratricopeptide (TPR) repeat protein